MEHRAAAAGLSQCHRASHSFAGCLTAHGYHQLKITFSEALEELAGFPVPGEALTLCVSSKLFPGMN